MTLLVITFTLAPEKWTECRSDFEQEAASLASAPGLRWQIWPKPDETGRATGCCLLESMEHTAAITLRQMLFLRDLGTRSISIKASTVDADLSAVTRGPCRPGAEPLVKLERRLSTIPGAGYGVYALEPIPEGRRIVEYTGIHRDESEFEEGDDAYVYLFAVAPGVVIDPRDGGSIARYFNHACTPNCTAVQDGRRIFVESLRDIEAGEELTYNYALRLGRRPTETDKQRYRCLCGDQNCRGTMLHLPAPRKKK